jgi:hypothetical protein
MTKLALHSPKQKRDAEKRMRKAAKQDRKAKRAEARAQERAARRGLTGDTRSRAQNRRPAQAPCGYWTKVPHVRTSKRALIGFRIGINVSV